MYITAKQRENKKKVKVFYIYVCESHRVNGNVKNVQKYFGSIKETDLKEDNLNIIEEAEMSGKWTEDEIELVERKLEQIANQL